MGTVFAESEVVSLVAQNKDVADIIHGLNVSVASKVGALAARLGKKNPGEYMMTGGVARNKGIIQALEEKLGAKLYICLLYTSTAAEVQIILAGEVADNQTKERVFDFLNQAEIGFVLKDRLYQLITAGKKLPVLLSELQSMELDKDLYGALMEILTA